MYPGVRVMTMFVRPGSARPRASHERRPMMIGQPIVEALKCWKSAGTCQDMAVPDPMIPLLSWAQIAASFVIRRPVP